jgi:prephenate dehydrogenase
MHVVIAGLGLIGGSLGMALRESGWKVGYIDPAVSREEAQEAGAADERLNRLEGDLIVIATPADVAAQLLSDLAGSPSLVTSVASVMNSLRDAATGVNFVAGHPFAGSELRGLSAARGDLFAGRPWFIDREETSVMEMIVAAGAEPVVVDAAEHDRVMAMTSHLPQVVATALASILEGIDERFIGTGARSMLRLAGSSYETWQPVLTQNEANISAAASELWRVMQRIGEEDFEKAQRLYRHPATRAAVKV